MSGLVKLSATPRFHPVKTITRESAHDALILEIAKRCNSIGNEIATTSGVPYAEQWTRLDGLRRQLAHELMRLGSAAEEAREMVE